MKCRVCKVNKPRRCFYVRETGKARTECRSCVIKRTRKWTKKNKKQARLYQKEYGLKRRYGITLLDLKRMEKDQHGLCAICGLKRELVVDHDHCSGAVRALLCQSCNLGLGQIERPGWFAQAMAYLDLHQNSTPVTPSQTETV